MRRALDLAIGGWGRVHPNPLVGAIVVRDGEVVGAGWHAEFGGPHAERVALQEAGERARGATLYCTLEPCNHTGKQPPCVDAIVVAGIARVVIALAEPNPIAQGGAVRLRDAGIEVAEGVEAERARRQNFRFLHTFAGRSRPFVAIKLAVSMDGMIADASGASHWLSGESARAWVHQLRAGYGGIAVGGTTAVRDNVRLTVRGTITPRVPPVRVVFDRRGQVAPTHGIFSDDRTVPVLMVTGREGGAERRTEWERAGATVIAADSLESSLEQVAAAGVDALLVEGGGQLAGALLHGGLVDRIYQVQSPLWLGQGVPAWSGLGSISIASAPRWHPVERQPLGDDTLLVLER